MKRTYLNLMHRWMTIKLFAAQIEHDNAVRIIHEARLEIDRAIGLAKQTRLKVESAEAAERMAGYEIMRHDRHRALGI